MPASAHPSDRAQPAAPLTASAALPAFPAGLMFHHFHGAGHAPGQGSLSADDFARLLAFAGRERLLPAGEWLERALAGRLRPGDLCLTFDDNLRSQYDVALPVLESLGLTVFWFVSTAVLQGHLARTTLYQRFIYDHFRTIDDFHAAFFEALSATTAWALVEGRLRSLDASTYLADFPFYTPGDRRFRYVRDELLGPELYRQTMDRLIVARGLTLRGLAAGLWLSEAHLLRLQARGHVIGLHSHTHPTRLAELSLRLQQREYAANQAYLASLLGLTPETVSHPCNSYGPRTLELLRNLGVRIGFRANLELQPHSALEFPRQDCANLLHAMRAG